MTTERSIFSLGFHDAYTEDAVAFLRELSSKGTIEDIRMTVTAKIPDVEASQLLRNASTCLESCGCTVYSPRADCPDPACPCRERAV